MGALRDVIRERKALRADPLGLNDGALLPTVPQRAPAEMPQPGVRTMGLLESDMVTAQVSLADLADQLRSEGEATVESIAWAPDPEPEPEPIAAAIPATKSVPPPLPPAPQRPQTLYPAARTCQNCHVPATGDYCANCYPRCGDQPPPPDTSILPTLDGCPPFTAAMVEYEQAS